MRKSIKNTLVAMAIAILPLAAIASYAPAHAREVKRKELINFIEYCRTECTQLRQVDPNKDYTKATLRELKGAARFYADQLEFADCSDYPRQAQVDKIIK